MPCPWGPAGPGGRQTKSPQAQGPWALRLRAFPGASRPPPPPPGNATAAARAWGDGVPHWKAPAMPVKRRNAHAKPDAPRRHSKRAPGDSPTPYCASADLGASYQGTTNPSSISYRRASRVSWSKRKYRSGRPPVSPKVESTYRVSPSKYTMFQAWPAPS